LKRGLQRLDRWPLVTRRTSHVRRAASRRSDSNLHGSASWKGSILRRGYRTRNPQSRPGKTTTRGQC
jgi:hypothetical protein